MSSTLILAEARSLARLAVPVATAQLGMMLLGTVDSIMVGHVSREALGAVTLGHVYTMASMVFGFGVMLSMDPLIAQAHGAQNRDAVRFWLQRGMVMAGVLAVLIVLSFLAAGPILRSLRQPPEVVPDAVRYIWVCAPGIPGLCLFFVLRQTVQAMSIVRPVVLAVLLANLVNVVLDWALIFGHLGCPPLGVVGAAWASTVSRWVMPLSLLFFGRRALAPYLCWPTRAVLSWAPFRRMLQVGIPTGFQVGLEVWVFLFATLFMGTLGAGALAGHQIANQLAALSFMVPLGIGAAASARVGQAIGRKDPSGARRSALVALGFGATFMALPAVLFASLSGPLARIYTDDPQVLAVATALLPIAALFQVFDGTQAVGSGVLRGAAETRFAALVNLVGYWGLALPTGLLLAFPAGLGPRGIWLGLTLGLAVVACVLVWRVNRRFTGDSTPGAVFATPSPDTSRPP